MAPLILEIKTSGIDMTNIQGAMKEGSGGKTPRKFFEDMPSTFALNTSADPKFAGVLLQIFDCFKQ